MLDDVELLPVLHMHIIVASNMTVCATCTGTCCTPHTALFVALYMPACCKGYCLFAAAKYTTSFSVVRNDKATDRQVHKFAGHT
jgi:hypothetical protein